MEPISEFNRVEENIILRIMIYYASKPLSFSIFLLLFFFSKFTNRRVGGKVTIRWRIMERRITKNRRGMFRGRATIIWGMRKPKIEEINWKEVVGMARGK